MIRVWEGQSIQISELSFVIKTIVLSSWDLIIVETKAELTVPIFVGCHIFFDLHCWRNKGRFDQVKSGGG